MNIKEQVQIGKIVRYRGKNYLVKVWYSARDRLYIVSYRTRTEEGLFVEYYEYSNIEVAVAEFSAGAGL